jgi:hypothetical protein
MSLQEMTTDKEENKIFIGFEYEMVHFLFFDSEK